MEDSNMKVSSHLQYVPFDARPKEIPGQVLYSTYNADSNDASGWSFNITSPAPNALLDNQVIIEYKIKIGAATLPANLLADAPTNVVDNLQIAFRGGYPICRSYLNLSATINGVNVNTQPNKWIDAMTRLCMDYEEQSSIATMSMGGELDVGAGYSLGVSGTGYAPVVTTRAVLNTGTTHISNGADTGAYGIWDWLNTSFDKRRSRLFKFLVDRRAQNAATGAYGPLVDASDDVDVIVYERLPLSPFFFFENKDIHQNIPNIRTLDLACQLLSTAATRREAILQCRDVAPGVTVKICDGTNQTPKLHIRWNMTTAPIPAQISIPCPLVKTFQERVSSNNTILNLPVETAAIPAEGYGTVDVNMRTINLEGIPDMFLIYCKKTIETSRDSNDHFYSIHQLDITIGGASGKIASMTAVEMYQAYLRNLSIIGGQRLSWDDWWRYHCCAVLLPEDLGIQKGPGFNFPTQMTINAKIRSYHIVPSQPNLAAVAIDAADSTRDFYCAIYYDKYFLTLSNTGAAKLELLKAVM